MACRRSSIASSTAIGKGISDEIELRSMEGTYLLSIRREQGDKCQIQYIERAVSREKFRCGGSALNLLRSTLRVATRVQRVCGQHGWQSVDIEKLDGFVSAARKLVRPQDREMDFPSTVDFLAAFGIEPVEEDPCMAYCRYVKQSKDRLHELDISFSAVAESFQVVL